MGCAGLDGLDYITYPWILKNSKPVLQVGLLEFPSMTQNTTPNSACGTIGHVQIIDVT